MNTKHWPNQLGTLAAQKRATAAQAEKDAVELRLLSQELASLAERIRPLLPRHRLSSALVSIVSAQEIVDGVRKGSK